MGRRQGPNTPGIAFVTGAARGLGNAVAVSFAKEGAKAVVIVDINDEETMALGKAAVEAHGAECLAIRADVTQEAEVASAVAQAVAKFGRIDYAANFAGIVGPPDSIVNLDVAKWKKTLDVNATGVMLCTKYEMIQMMKQDSLAVEDGRPPQRGAIVNCASVNSLLTMPGTGPYTASKHACYGITKTAALEGRSHGIRVNAVSPGFLLTKMAEESLMKDDVVDSRGMAMWQYFVSRQGRSASFDEIGDVVALMCTPKMSLVVGQNLFIDG
ncbi:3-oxoacyl-[acyl-carrier-protein] reductase FabG [Cladophialophora carrionii]|uniref:3-oxoacyl-[acyl-carrier-protein] reductase FabG n=1 Tax=Cladophialophora carrionii TaxID=86049 RepID=A0A1C1C9Y0_9EURO|nr:3-oxoacyl-[acyl-carrier-protein] reductase FabG [Cladophialophora carrionii]